MAASPRGLRRLSPGRAAPAAAGDAFVTGFLLFSAEFPREAGAGRWLGRAGPRPAACCGDVPLTATGPCPEHEHVTPPALSVKCAKALALGLGVCGFFFFSVSVKFCPSQFFQEEGKSLTGK